MFPHMLQEDDCAPSVAAPDHSRALILPSVDGADCEAMEAGRTVNGPVALHTP
jgi:hypothetical protein